MSLGQLLKCTFCQKPQSDAKVLIASPDRLTYVCEECALQPARLKGIPLESVGPSPSAPSGVFGFLRRGRPKSALKCSFCWKQVGIPDLHRSALENATQAQICSECLDVCRQILRQEYGTSLDGRDVDKRPVRIRADFNGLFGELLCISHSESCSDEFERPVLLCTGMKLTAYDEDVDENGNPDDLIASGTVEPAPIWLRCNGSRWVLKIDENGVRHQSDIENRKGVGDLMGRRMQEGDALKTIYDSVLERRVCFYRHSDGTFGFLEWNFSHEEKSWVPTRIGQGSRLSTLEDAIREATGRVDWLASAVSSA